MASNKVVNTEGMEYRFLGNTGLKVPVLSFGGWVTGGGSVADEIFKQCMQEAWKAGINMFDTAEGYAGGQCETVMGKVFKEVDWDRTSYIVSTKLFFGDDTPNHPNAKGLSRKHLMEAMNKSLKRLQLDYVDIIMAHRPDPLTPMEETVRAFTQMINDGKAHYWGTSEWSAFEIEHAHHIATKEHLIAPIADQCQYNLLVRNKLEQEYAPLYKLYHYGTTIWSPLKSGVLTGKYNDGIPKGSRFDSEDPQMQGFAKQLETEQGKADLAKVKKLGDVAKNLGTDTATLALAWTIYNKHVSTCILGASRPEQVVRNLKAMDVYKKLNDDTIKKIEDIFQNKPAEISLWGRWP